MATNVVHVLDADPDLGHGLDEAELALAAQHLVARELRVPAGDWLGDCPLGDGPADLGLLVLDGLAVRETVLGRHATAELVGAGDILRPWDHTDDGSPIGADNAWRVLEPLNCAVLDGRFTALCGRFPPVTAAIVSRTLRRARLLGTLLAVSAMPRLDARLLTLLWHLADRWGKVGPDGTIVPLPLTHATLAQLTGAQRPSVTSALGTLEELDLVRRNADEPGFLLLGDPPGDPEQTLSALQQATSSA